MSRVSVVVAVYNVEPYLRECLSSVAQQTVGDLEVVVVDDGSTDGSALIADEFAARDSRFRVLRQENGGLGNARNSGAGAARAGEFLAFVDGDDVLPRNAYELLLGALEESGSDFATGNVHRLGPGGVTAQALFLARTFSHTRLRTHVKRFRPLLEDRIVPNKLWRRSFWDAQGFRFPEGMLHEDIPVVVPAQFAAGSVDVISEPVYLYRTRELSITGRRAEKPALLDRVRAIEMVLAYFDSHRMRRARRWYEQSILANDLAYYLNVLQLADDEYRALFLERVPPLVSSVSDEHLLAIDRLKWELVRRGRMDEVLEVLRFQDERMTDTPPVRKGRHWYGDYPFRGDPRLDIPKAVYRLDRELVLEARVDDLRWDGSALTVKGEAAIAGLAADHQRLEVALVRRGRLARLRRRLAPVRMETSSRGRSFAASVDARTLRGDGTWDLHVTARAEGVTRRRTRFAVDGTRALRAASSVVDEALVTATPAPSGQLLVRRRSRWAYLDSGDMEGIAAAGDLRLSLVASAGAGTLDIPAPREGRRFRAALPLDELERQRAAGASDWDLYFAIRGERGRLEMASDLPEHLFGELLLHRSRFGHALLAVRPALVLATTVNGQRLEGLLTAAAEELVLVARDGSGRHLLPLTAADGRFHASLDPLPGSGVWDVYAGEAPLLLSQTLYPQLPLELSGARLGMTAEQRAVLEVD